MTTQRVFNFSAGPATLPEAVLQQARDEMLNFAGSGCSIMEMSHRGKEFMSVAETAEQDLRELLQIPTHYKVLFLQGGATGQFAAIPMNLLRDRSKIDYVNTGAWSKKAIAEAKKFATVNVVASGESDSFNHIPDISSWQCDAESAYLHYTPNETIGGVEFHFIPEVGDLPLVVDMSSTILSRPLDVSRFGLIYAGAQKNIGPAGLTVVIVREDLIGEALPGTPAFLNYQVQLENDSMYNTPPTYSWYLAGLVFKWLKQQGGLEAMGRSNERKASKLYHAIDQSDFYHNPVQPDCRSWMNIPFTLARPELDNEFLAQSKQAGLVALKGHRSVGGMRASIYNAMPEAGVDTLIDFMAEFERSHG